MGKIILTIVSVFFISSGNTISTIADTCKSASDGVLNMHDALIKFNLDDPEEFRKYKAFREEQLKQAKLYHYLDCSRFGTF